MDTSSTIKKLKIYASTSDKIGGISLHDYIVRSAKDFGISGATVYRGVMGYGASSAISSSKFWELTEKLPVVIELIDEAKKIAAFYASVKHHLIEMPKGCLVTIEDVNVLLCKKGKH